MKLEDILLELKSTYNEVKSLSDVLEMVFKVLPEEYESTVDMLKQKEQDKGTLTMDEVKKALGAKYHIILGRKKKKYRGKRK